ncbi:MAG: efflux RND transporter periplasmic adaptor subunit [Gemmataceae bacterium]
MSSNKSKGANAPFFGNELTFRHFLTSRRTILGIVVVVLAGLGIGTVLAVGGKAQGPSNENKPGARLMPVQVQSMREVFSFSQKRTYTGIVTASRTTELAFNRPSGRIEKMLVKQGSQVKKGDELAILDTEELLASRDQLVAQKAEAEARLAQFRRGYRREKIAAAEALMHDLEAQMQLATMNFKRQIRLSTRDAGSQQDYDTAQYTLQSAKAKLANAKENWADLKKGYREEETAAQKAVVDRLAASIRSIDVQLRDSTLLAPFAGTISTRHVDEGAIVAPNMPILRLVESGKLEVRVGLPAATVLRLDKRESHPVLIGDQSSPAKSLSPTLSRILPELDAQTRTREVIFQLDEGAPYLGVPGQIARLALEEERPTNGYWVPSTALVRSSRGLWAVYVVKKETDDTGIVQRREVEVFYTEGDRVLTRGTLRPNDLVITTGVHRDVPKQRVRIVES